MLLYVKNVIKCSVSSCWMINWLYDSFPGLVRELEEDLEVGINDDQDQEIDVIAKDHGLVTEKGLGQDHVTEKTERGPDQDLVIESDQGLEIETERDHAQDHGIAKDQGLEIENVLREVQVVPVAAAKVEEKMISKMNQNSLIPQLWIR